LNYVLRAGGLTEDQIQLRLTDAPPERGSPAFPGGQTVTIERSDYNIVSGKCALEAAMWNFVQSRKPYKLIWIVNDGDLDGVGSQTGLRNTVRIFELVPFDTVADCLLDGVSKCLVFVAVFELCYSGGVTESIMFRILQRAFERRKFLRLSGSSSPLRDRVPLPPSF
jgi:hypothetical protein